MFQNLLIIGTFIYVKSMIYVRLLYGTEYLRPVYMYIILLYILELCCMQIALQCSIYESDNN